jgi:hypothetical protein
MRPHEGLNVFALEVRRAIETASRSALPDVSKAMWSAFTAGYLNDEQAEELSGLIEARRALPPPHKPVGVGSKPKMPKSIERRRRWAAAGRLPQHLAARFSLAEQAALSVIAVEVIAKGDCRLCIGHIAALAGVGETSVRNAVRAARDMKLVSVEERRLSRWRNDPNIVRVVSPDWLAWLSIGSRKGGCKSVKGSIPKIFRGGDETVRTAARGMREEIGGEARRQDASWIRLQPRRALSRAWKRPE